MRIKPIHPHARLKGIIVREGVNDGKTVQANDEEGGVNIGWGRVMGKVGESVLPGMELG